MQELTLPSAPAEGCVVVGGRQVGEGTYQQALLQLSICGTKALDLKAKVKWNTKIAELQMRSQLSEGPFWNPIFQVEFRARIHVLVTWWQLPRLIGLLVYRLSNDVTRVCGNQDYVTDTIFPSHLLDLDTNSACFTWFSCWLSGNLNSFKDIMKSAIPQAELGHTNEEKKGGERSRLDEEYISLQRSNYLVIKNGERRCSFNVNEWGQRLQEPKTGSALVWCPHVYFLTLFSNIPKILPPSQNTCLCDCIWKCNM